MVMEQRGKPTGAPVLQGMIGATHDQRAAVFHENDPRGSLRGQLRLGAVTTANQSTAANQ
jgi:hypothetical protein